MDAVRRRARANAVGALQYHVAGLDWFASAVDWAACYHDLGKLHPANQRVLAGCDSAVPLPTNHVDAGTAALIQRRLREAAIVAYCHHRGLANFPEERAKCDGLSPFRDVIWRNVDLELGDLLLHHREAAGEDPLCSYPPGNPTGLEWRLLLSCLVDADHSDTADYYQQSVKVDRPEPRWADRLAALDAYVESLADGTSRSCYRSALYEACRAGDAARDFYACESPVGSGKTTAVMAYLLQAAVRLKLRHIFVVLPYTNIIRQSVDVYRHALCLPGEDPETIVAAHHHLAEFERPESRHLATLWQSPVIVTTAVQFFETLGAAGTAKLRKLHELPGSAAFIDEAHAAMPIHLWPFMWNQMEELATKWGCRFVLGSGSLATFWENRRLAPYFRTPRSIPRLAPQSLGAAGDVAEFARVNYQSRTAPCDLDGLARWIESTPGPRVVVMNTVQSAAILARELRARGGDVAHLSTALTPRDRDAVVKSVQWKLKSEPNGCWTLVATSCVEAGLDFDFAAGFRERCSAASLVQLGGRVNRHAQRGRSTVWDFLTRDPMLTGHPGTDASRSVVGNLFRDGLWNTMGAAELMTKALEWELIEHSAEGRLDELKRLENQENYPELERCTRLIQADTSLVVVDTALQKQLSVRAKVSFRQLLAGSVQVWSTRIRKLSLKEIPGLPGVFLWGYDYDPEFLGIMHGILPLIKADQDGYLFI